ncbi:MAG: family 78 glycoside hydrolase catalytic domain [Bacteroidales bacterium]|nr:family 78 glycoside hydrolase catalytic domain [Bacteroidales bacterium]
MVYYGETYDARLEQPDWCKASFDDAQWGKVAIRKAPFGRLTAQTSPSDKVMEQLKPVKIEKLSNGNYFVGFGKEISGWVRLINVSAPAGHKIDISFNANLYSGDNAYIFKGEGSENYAPRFNWFVFSGVEIKNWYGELKPENIIAESVYTEVPVTSVFETSNPMFNRINEIWRTSQQDNMHGAIASDCPHRERNGYTGDGQVACITVMHNFDARAFYQKWIADMLEASDATTGYVPNGAPGNLVVVVAWLGGQLSALCHGNFTSIMVQRICWKITSKECKATSATCKPGSIKRVLCFQNAPVTMAKF